MSERTKIQWCHHTINFWIGCTKLVGGKVAGTLVREDPACFHCYAAEQDHFRFSRTMDGGTKAKPISHWGNGAPRHITQTWTEPLKWNAASGQNSPDGERKRVFCGSLCDWADCEVSDDLRSRAFDVIDRCPDLDWMLLSKREQKAVEFLTARYGRKLPDHLWLGFSAGTQPAYDIRLEAMMRMDAQVKFFSFEPLFEDIQLKYHGDWAVRPFDLAIYGGESGPAARPQNVGHIRRGIQQCRRLNIAPFVKQAGAIPFETIQPARFSERWPGTGHWKDGEFFPSLKDKKGGDWDEWPAALRVREFPKTNSTEANEGNQVPASLPSLPSVESV